VGFAHGSQSVESNNLVGAAWMVGAVAVMALQIFVSLRVGRKR